MSEHLRTINAAGRMIQWHDAARVMVLDAVTGEPQRFGPHKNAIGELPDALVFLRDGCPPGWESRFVVVQMRCIVGALL